MDTKEKKIIGIISGGIVVLFAAGGILFIVLGEGIETVYYFSQIFSAIFVVLGVVIAMFQYIISSKEQKDARESELRIRERELLEIEKDRIQKAIDLAEYYKDNILKNATIITQLYKNTGIQSILDTIRIEDMREFDKHELESLLSSEQQEKIEEITNSQMFKEEVAKCCAIYGVGKDTRELLKNDKNEIDAIIREFELKREYGWIVSEVLNNTEYFAMNFTHKTADDSVIYQSLHSSYLSIIRALYYDISNNNKPGGDKLYTNAIELFNVWKEKYLEKKAEEILSKRKTTSKGSELSIKK